MTTPALTPTDFGTKFADIQSSITPAVLDLINRSRKTAQLRINGLHVVQSSGWIESVNCCKSGGG